MHLLIFYLSTQCPLLLNGMFFVENMLKWCAAKGCCDVNPEIDPCDLFERLWHSILDIRWSDSNWEFIVGLSFWSICFFSLYWFVFIARLCGGFDFFVLFVCGLEKIKAHPFLYWFVFTARLCGGFLWRLFMNLYELEYRLSNFRVHSSN